MLLVIFFIARGRWRRMTQLSSQSSPKDGGKPPGGVPVVPAGLPIFGHPVYKQGSADSEEPLVRNRFWMPRALRWLQRKSPDEPDRAVVSLPSYPAVLYVL